jgi:predicted nucleic-acid-binding protein
MIGVDTNVLVRYLVRDDVAQSRRARDRLDAACTNDEPGFISHLVVSELCWVLRGAYRYRRAAIAGVIEALLRTPQLRLEDEALVAGALAVYRTSDADFADCLIGLIHRRAGCGTTVTFDAAAAALGAFTAL